MDRVIVLALLVRQRRRIFSSWRTLFDDFKLALFKFKLAVFLKSAHLFKEGSQYDSDHIFQVQFNLLFRVSALFQGGVGRAIREDGVLLKFDFFEDKV